MPRILIPATLRRLTDGAEEFIATGSNLAVIFDELELRFPDLAPSLRHMGRLRRFVRVAVNELVIRDEDWFNVLVGPTDDVTIIVSIAGG